MDTSQINTVSKAGGKVKVTAATFGCKYNSKKECYNFLTQGCKAYLPSYECTVVYWLKQLING